MNATRSIVLIVLVWVALSAAACQALVATPEEAFIASFATATATPAPTSTPSPTVVPTATARPRPTPVMLPADIPVVLALMPLRVGASRVYSVTLLHRPAYQPLRWNGIITETIVAESNEGAGRVFRAQRIGKLPLGTPPHEPTYNYVALDNRLYQLFDGMNPRDLIARDGAGHEAELIAVWPAAIGQTWGDPNLVSIDGATYRWRFEGLEDMQTPASGEDIWLDCARFVFRAPPAVTIRWYCPGIGLARYRHLRKANTYDEVWELLRFE